MKSSLEIIFMEKFKRLLSFFLASNVIVAKADVLLIPICLLGGGGWGEFCAFIRKSRIFFFNPEVQKGCNDMAWHGMSVCVCLCVCVFCFVLF